MRHPSSVLNVRSTWPVVMLTTSSALLPSAVVTTWVSSIQRTSWGARYSPRSIVLIVSPLGSAIRSSFAAGALLVVVGDHHRAPIRRRRRFMRPTDDRDVRYASSFSDRSASPCRIAG